MHERRFNGGVDRLRTPERLALLEVEKVIELSSKNITTGRVLDAGTGTGIFAEAFANHGFEVACIDVSDEMLKTAAKYIPQAEFKNAAVERLPFENNSFDLTFMGLVLHEADDRLQALKEAKRVTRQRIAILEWPYEMGLQGPPPDHRIKPEVLKSLLKETGLIDYEIMNLKHLQLLLINL